MDVPSPSLHLMGPPDVAEVMAIERRAYENGWPATAFERELTQNAMARYVVLRRGEQALGFAGLWLMVDQAHIVTVAVLPEARRQALGRILVHGLIELALAHHMDEATLEVRRSNEPARALYRSYGFYEVGLRKAYYADNREDAIIMTTEPLTSGPYQARLAQLGEALRTRYPGLDLKPAGLTLEAGHQA